MVADARIPATPSSQEVLYRLFPDVKPPPSHLAPARSPNSGPEATAVLLKALRDNHDRSHLFFNDIKYHNHASHHLLAIYALGAPAPVLNAAYEDTHLDHMRDSYVAPEGVMITDDNFTNYLGDDRYYNAYLEYFNRVVLEPGATISSILEKYIFSDYYNIRTPQQGAQQPQMLNRLLEKLVHPLIQVGHGAEFGMPGLVAEGLAWTSVHLAGATTLVTRLLFTPVRTTPITDAERNDPEWMPKPGSRLRALNILTLILRDTRFSPKLVYGSHALDKYGFDALLKPYGEVVNKYAEFWDCHVQTQEDLEARLEELVWVATIIYGVGAWGGNHAPYGADFYIAHLVTSVSFIPSICAYVSHASQEKLLRAHFLTCITWWILRGRPGFALKEFTSHPPPPLPKVPGSRYSNALPGCQPTPSASAVPSPMSPFAVMPNPWYPLLTDVIVHPNEHLCKVQRALAHFSVLYGHRETGFVMEELHKDGVEVDPEYAYLDGSVFLRIAWLTGAALGRPSRGENDSRQWNWQEFEKVNGPEMESSKKYERAKL